MAMTRHTTRGEEQTNKTTMKEEQQTRMITVRSVGQMVVTNHVEDWRHLIYFYIWIPPIGGQGGCIEVVWSPLHIHHVLESILGLTGHRDSHSEAIIFYFMGNAPLTLLYSVIEKGGGWLWFLLKWNICLSKNKFGGISGILLGTIGAGIMVI